MILIHFIVNQNNTNSDEVVNGPDQGAPVKFTKDELNIPKEPRIYKRKSSSKWKVILTTWLIL